MWPRSTVPEFVARQVTGLHAARRRTDHPAQPLFTCIDRAKCSLISARIERIIIAWACGKRPDDFTGQLARCDPVGAIVQTLEYSIVDAEIEPPSLAWMRDQAAHIGTWQPTPNLLPLLTPIIAAEQTLAPANIHDSEPKGVWDNRSYTLTGQLVLPCCGPRLTAI